MNKKQRFMTAMFLKGVADGLLNKQADDLVKSASKAYATGQNVALGYTKDGGPGSGLKLSDYLETHLPEFAGE